MHIVKTVTNRQTTLARWAAPILLTMVIAGLPSIAQSQESAAVSKSDTDFATVAESSNYRATARGSQVETLLKRIDTAWASAKLESIGQTVEGRAIWALVVEPSSKSNSRPLTVLLLGGIHSGECDGKEAILALARDMALGKLGSDWSQLRLIFVPNFNADGAERLGKLHRPGQNGPADGAGIRENAQGLDLNRDFVKLETPEVRSLVAAINRFNVDVLIDTHTTNGSLHRYDLTYAVPNNPVANRAVDKWLREKMLPVVTDRMRESGLAAFYYGNFDASHRKWSTYGDEPRYGTEYMGLRGRIGILAESYAYAPYQRRVEATQSFVKEVLQMLTQNAAELCKAIDESAGSGSAFDRSRDLPIQAAPARTVENAKVLGYQQTDGTPPRGPFGPDSIVKLQTRDYTAELWAHSEILKSVKLPAAYAIAKQYSWAVSRLAMHGVALEKLTARQSVRGELSKIAKMDTEESYQGHRLRRVVVENGASDTVLEPGSYIVRTDQALGRLASYLLEPESDDSLAAWNFFDPDLQAGERFPVVRLLETNFTTDSYVKAVAERGERLSLESIMKPGKTADFGNTFASPPIWLEGNSEYLVRKESGWLAVEAATGSQRPFEANRSLAKALDALEAFEAEEARQSASPQAFTSDYRFALVDHKNDLYFYDQRGDKVRQLTHSPSDDEQLAELSPTGRHAAFIRDNNLWIVDCETTEVRQLTKNGSRELLNGILDWVYQEELYGRGNFRAFWWSPNGEHIAFLQLDQSPVHHYRVSDSIHFRQELEDTRYPKAGDPLPVARAFVAGVADGKLREIDLSGFPADDRLIVRVTWSPSNQLWLQVQNRIQNKQNILLADSSTGTTRTVHSEQSPGWIEIRSTPKFLSGGDFLWLSDLPDGRTHLYRIDATSGKRTALTSGPWDVSDLLSVSPDGKQAYIAGNISHPTETQLLAVDTEIGKTRQITHASGTHRISIDPRGEYFIDSFSSHDSPSTTSLRNMKDDLLRVLSAPVSDRHEYVAIQPPRLHKITARDGLELQALLMLPPGVSEAKATEKLPVLFFVYGGPQAPTVSNAWHDRYYWWHQYLCQEGFAVVLCDNRSARGRGVKDTWKIYRDMGKIELQDLEDAARWVGQQPWANADRMGIWGWSYGGYFTAYALTHSQLFKAGIAGAPVTDWHNYDAIYTERYMDLPRNNQEGYKTSSVVEAAERLHGRLLLIHGERDDNVHISNTLQLAFALQKAAKPFDLMIYPKNRHGIADPSQRYHMHQMMVEFLRKHLLQ